MAENAIFGIWEWRIGQLAATCVQGSQTNVISEGRELFSVVEARQDHLENVEVTNPGPVQTMGVVPPGFGICPNLARLAPSFTSPVGTSPIIIGIFTKLALCNVATFNEIFRNTDNVEIREFPDTEMNKLRRYQDCDADLIWSQILTLRRVIRTRIIASLNKSTDGSPAQSTDLDVINPCRINVNISAHSADSSELKRIVSTPRAGDVNDAIKAPNSGRRKHFHSNRMTRSPPYSSTQPREEGGYGRFRACAPHLFRSFSGCAVAPSIFRYF